jgi:alginate O-acetyltransferase complex protein AlgJ
VPIVLFSIGIYSIFCVNDEKLSFENRPLEICSLIELSRVESYKFGFLKLKKCIEDHLIIKPYIVILNHALKKHYGKSGDPNILIGKNGWQFLSNANDINGQYRGVNRYTEIELRRAVHNILYYREKLKLLGSNLYIIVIPTQQVMYSEYLPNYLKVVNTERRVHQLINALGDFQPEIPILYLESCLRAHKKDGLMFNRTEGHWTELGALYGFECISKFLGSKNKDINLVNPSLYLKTYTYVNFPPISYNEKLITVTNPSLKFNTINSFENSDRTVYIHSENYINKPKTLIIGDSFMENSRQFIADAFQNAHEIHSQQQGLGFKTIIRDKPTNIIYIFTERFLNNVFYDISEISPEKYSKLDNPAIKSTYNIDNFQINSKDIRVSGWIHDHRGIEPHRIVVIINNNPIYQSNPNRPRPDLTKADNLFGFDFKVLHDNSNINSVDLIIHFYDGTAEKISIYSKH